MGIFGGLTQAVEALETTTVAVAGVSAATGAADAQPSTGGFNIATLNLDNALKAAQSGAIPAESPSMANYGASLDGAFGNAPGAAKEKGGPDIAS